MGDKIIIPMGGLEFKLNQDPTNGSTESEKDLHRWILPTFEKQLRSYDWNKLMHDANLFEKAALTVMVSENVSSCFQIHHTNEEQKFIYNMIALPANMVKDAKQDMNREITLYSGKEVSYSSKTHFEYLLGHEITHCFYNPDEKDLSEAVADRIGLKLIQGEKDEEKITASYIATMLIEAQILGYTDMRSVEPLVSRFNLSKESKGLLQSELDSYFLNPENAKQGYMIKKGNFNHPDPNCADYYSQGFIKLLYMEQCPFP